MLIVGEAPPPSATESRVKEQMPSTSESFGEQFSFKRMMVLIIEYLTVALEKETWVVAKLIVVRPSKVLFGIYANIRQIVISLSSE